VLTSLGAAALVWALFGSAVGNAFLRGVFASAVANTAAAVGGPLIGDWASLIAPYVGGLGALGTLLGTPKPRERLVMLASYASGFATASAVSDTIIDVAVLGGLVGAGFGRLVVEVYKVYLGVMAYFGAFMTLIFGSPIALFVAAALTFWALLVVYNAADEAVDSIYYTTVYGLRKHVGVVLTVSPLIGFARIVFSAGFGIILGILLLTVIVTAILVIWWIYIMGLMLLFVGAAGGEIMWEAALYVIAFNTWVTAGATMAQLVMSAVQKIFDFIQGLVRSVAEPFANRMYRALIFVATVAVMSFGALATAGAMLAAHALVGAALVYQISIGRRQVQRYINTMDFYLIGSLAPLAIAMAVAALFGAI